MRRFNKLIAILCSATMVLGSSVTAFATAPTSTGGTGTVLAYDYDTIVVPTAIKVTFNPQGLPIKIGEANEAAVTTTDKVVSLNYGIASKASLDKKVVVKFAANFVKSGEDDPEITFVDAEAKAQPKTTDNANGATSEEYKVYLYVAPAAAAPTTSADAAFAVSGDQGSKTDNATAANLSDVKMNAATAGLSTFATAASSPKNSAYANMGFKLGKATYGLKADGSIDFDTTQSDLDSKLEMTTLGGVTGFTIKGMMNENADWTKANISAINITPVYTVAAAGDEAAVADTASVITLTAAADTAEPDKPMSAEEIAAAEAAAAAAGFKTDHAAVIALTADTVEGTEEELAAIEAAIDAFGELSEAAKAVLAAEETPITAETLAAIKTASEAAATPAVVEYQLELNNNTGNLTYTFTSDLPTGSVSAMKLNGETKGAGQITKGNIAYSSGKVTIKAEAVTTIGIKTGDKIVLTIGGKDYNFKY